MSISTFIIGYIDFNERPPKAVIHEITRILRLPKVKYVDDLPEGWVKEASHSYYINKFNSWSFMDLNWSSSYVDPDNLKSYDKYIYKYKSLFSSCHIAWFYLDDEADETYRI